MSKVKFPFQIFFSQEILLGLVEKTKQLHVLLALVECHCTTITFDLWMFEGAYDVFALIINFLGKD
jgi:hypothetical protein